MPISRDQIEALSKQVFIVEYLLNGMFPCQSDADHRNLIDYNQVELLQELDFVARIFECLTDVERTEVGVVRENRFEGNLEERMHSHSTHINSRDTCGRQYHKLFVGVVTNILQERALPRASLSGEENRLVRFVDKLPKSAEFGVIEVEVVR